jgi:hypothetical protein
MPHIQYSRAAEYGVNGSTAPRKFQVKNGSVMKFEYKKQILQEI